MTLQTIFYIIGILCMSLYTVLLIAVVILLFYIKKKMTDFSKMVEEKVSEVKTIMHSPRDMAATVGATLADKAAEFIKSKSKKEK